MKPGKRATRIFFFASLLTISTVFLLRTRPVQATLGYMHIFSIYLRVETEIMQRTPAGQYYEALFWKHNDEVMQIMQSHPEHNEAFLQALIVFVPELEALLNGDGGKVYVTAKHVESLQAELDWFASTGSLALQEDIKREQQRLPLDQFVGMTMSESLDFINSTWSPDSPASKTPVPNSDGKWAYFVHNGIYFEYPGNYSLQISGSEKDYIYLIPTQGSPEHWHPFVMKVRIWSIPANQYVADNLDYWFSHENVVWENPIQNAEFPGVAFIRTRGNPSNIELHALAYNPEKRLAVEVWVLIMESRQFPTDHDYSTMVTQQYEYFQHLVDSIRLQMP